MLSFVNYHGGKWRAASHYGPPTHDHVIEPFAGFAGYSTYWGPPKVTLVEIDPVIVGVWRYLQRATPQDIMRLPTEVNALDELPSHVCQEARDLIGFWLKRGLPTPAKCRSGCARLDSAYRYRFWGQEVRHRLATQVEGIRHWRIIHGSYEDAPDIVAHWHIDPPYQATGDCYRYRKVDYQALAQWSLRRRSFAHVCEQAGAAWLPFEPFTIVHSHRPRGFSSEVLFELDRRGGAGLAS